MYCCVVESSSKESSIEVARMKLIAVIMVYNCGEVLPDTLKSIDGLVDEIHCFDGRYAYHAPVELLYSTDDTRMVIENFALTSKSKTIYNKLPSLMYEANARTFSIQDIKVGDVLEFFTEIEKPREK